MIDLFLREELEKVEDSILAPWGSRSRHSRGRKYPESESNSRTCYQRDIDRIAHSRAFRRLEYKTQVFVNYEGDHYRTRLTHSLEVSLVARSIARSLGLNPDLTEAIALAHDMGHTPFGHAGEEILNEITEKIGGFEHNRQGLRVVELLETRYPNFPGLNLSWEVREGIIKHCSRFDQPDNSSYDPDKSVSLEGQVVNLADELAYNCHDLEDGLRSQIITLDQLSSLAIWQKIYQTINGSSLSDVYLRHESVRNLKDFLVKDAIRTSYQRICISKIKSVDDARNYPENIIQFSDETHEMLRELSNFLLENFYFHHRVTRMTTKAKWLLKDLFNRYEVTPRLLPEKIQKMMNLNDPDSIKRVVCDYIAGMTDRFALDEYAKLTDPGTPV